MIEIRPYGLIIALALVTGYLLSLLKKEKYGFKSEDLENLFLLMVPLGMVGARLYHVFDKWEYYSQHLMEIVAVWNGGLGIFGAVGGGILGLIVAKKVFNFQFSIFNFLDFAMPSLAIGQAIGRWGNFFNREAFGPPTSLPWKWYIPPELRPEYWKDYSFFHPTFLYESLWALIGFTILLLLEKRVPDCRTGRLPELAEQRSLRHPLAKNFYHSPIYSTSPGLLTGFYAFWYGLGRFFFEFLRFDTAEVSGIKLAQVISLLSLVAGVWLMKRSLSIGKTLV